MLNMVVIIETTVLFRANIVLNGGELLFAVGMDVSVLQSEMRQTKVEILVWSYENM